MLLFRKNRGESQNQNTKDNNILSEKMAHNYRFCQISFITMSPDHDKTYSSPSLLCVCGVPCSKGESGGCTDELQRVLLFPAVFQVFLAVPFHWAPAQRLLKLKMLLWAEWGRGLADAESLSHVPNSPLQQGCGLTLSCALLSTEGTAGCSPELLHGNTCMMTSSNAPQLRTSENPASEKPTS